MRKIMISDITLRENQFSFKEKIEIAKLLERLNVDIIEVPKILNERTDTLFLHTIAPLIESSALSCPVELDKASVEKSWNALSGAKKPMLHVAVPTSTVQMEYMCHKKPAAVLELISEIVSYAAALCGNVEFSALDATRSEFEFLSKAIGTALDAGAKSITICDTAGQMLPTELEQFIAKLYAALPKLTDVDFACECSDELCMSASASISAVNSGATVIKTSMTGSCASSLKAVAHVLSARGDSMGISSGLRYTKLNYSIDKMMYMTSGETAVRPSGDFSEMTLDGGADIREIAASVLKLGYELSDEDMSKVYEEFKKVAEKKKVGAKELDAIVASAALQVPPTYKVKNYVVNNGNIISATSNIELVKNGSEISGVAIGDGPIDASFRAIEQIAGQHFELDDFQIQAVTEGHEAVGSAVVKLRSGGKLYSGRGVSTDIIGASIYAYVNALNKICFEE